MSLFQCQFNEHYSTHHTQNWYNIILIFASSLQHLKLPPLSFEKCTSTRCFMRHLVGMMRSMKNIFSFFLVFYIFLREKFLSEFLSHISVHVYQTQSPTCPILVSSHWIHCSDIILVIVCCCVCDIYIKSFFELRFIVVNRIMDCAIFPLGMEELTENGTKKFSHIFGNLIDHLRENSRRQINTYRLLFGTTNVLTWWRTFGFDKIFDFSDYESEFSFTWCSVAWNWQVWS